MKTMQFTKNEMKQEKKVSEVIESAVSELLSSNDLSKRVYPIDCVNFIEPLNSTIKFDYKMSHSFIPVRDRHGPFFGNIINR